jgi:Tol biopolymer transport system component
MMSEDLKQQLERAARHYAPPPDALERLVDERERGQRRGRFTALAVGLVIAVVVVGATLLASRHGSGVRPQGEPSETPAVPTNGDLLYSRQAGGWHLFTADPVTGTEQMITHGTRDYGSDWSPDGTKVVYGAESGPSGNEIVIANADGSDPHVIGVGSAPAWSPDGTRIAYAGAGDAIWIMAIDGSDAHAVTDPSNAGPGTGQDKPFDYYPAWSPDGRSIAYTRVVAHRSVPTMSDGMTTDVTLQELRVWHDGGGATDTVLTDAYTSLGRPDWSPDGSSIVFTGAPTLFHEKETNGITWPRVLVIPSAGGPVDAITPDDQSWCSGAMWSPDGMWIAYVGHHDLLYATRPDGSGNHALPVDTHGAEIIEPSWGVAP